MKFAIHPFRRALKVTPAKILLAVFIAGGAFAWRMAVQTDREMRSDLLRQTQLIGQVVDVDLVKALAGTAADLEKPEYQRLKEQLIDIRHLNSKCRFLYLLGRKADGMVFFHADSEPADSKDYSPPGQMYEEASEICRAVFDTRSERVLGPVIDRWGTWVTAMVPVTDPSSGKLITVLGMYVDASSWKWALARAIQPPLLLMLALAAILGIGTGLLLRRSRPSGAFPLWRRHLESALLVAVGLVLTLFAAWIAYTHESRNEAQSFKTLAASRTADLDETLRKLSDVELEGLASYCTGSRNITPEGFRQYTHYLTRTPIIQAWEWIPSVSAADKSRFEQEARAGGLADFEIWQKASGGMRVPASGRDVYYPVFCVTPWSGNERALGYDLGSEPIRQSALEAAARTRLTTGTDPLTLVQETGHQKGMLIYRPVNSADEPARLRGFALAVLRLETMLQSAEPDQSLSITLSLLRKDGTLEKLATSCDADYVSDSGLSETRPIPLFGKVFAATAQTGPEFEHTHHPRRAGLLTALTGSLLTASLAIVIGMMLRRREELERLVAERTSDLTESEERHRAMFEKNRSIQLLVDPRDGAIMDANSAACEFYGYARKQLLQMKITEINTLPPAEVYKEMEAARSEGCKGFYFRHLLSTGELKEVEVHSSPIPIKGKECLYSIIHDVTERKHAEQLIEHLNEIQRHLLLFATEFVNVPVNRQDEAIQQALTTLGRLIQADRAYLFDYDFAGGVTHNTHEWCAEGIAPQIQKMQQVPIALAPMWTETHRRGELIHIASVAALPQNDPLKQVLLDQEIRSLITLPLISPGGCLGFVGFDAVSHERVWGPDEIALLRVLAEVFANFKVRRLAEGELRQMNADRGMLLDTMSAQVWYLTDPETYGLANRAHAEFLGLPREAIQHKRLGAFLPPEVAAVCLKSNSEVFATRNAVRTHEWVTSGAGNRRLLEIFKNPFIAETGSVAYVVCVGYDITERQRLQDELVQSRNESERTARAKATFLAVMSHEIRTPLNVILGYAQIMNRECVKCAKKKNIEAIQKSGEHLLGLINDILTISQRDSQSMPLNECAFDVLQLVEDMRMLFSRHPDARGLVIETECAAEMPQYLYADKGKIRQVLLNLVGNAVKFTDQGFVRIRIGCLPKEALYMPADTDEGTHTRKVAVEVEDSGRGIPEDLLDGVFEAFVKIGSPTDTKMGSGIGLPLSRRYAQALGGDVTVTSRVGKGSVFRFTFSAQVVTATHVTETTQGAIRVRRENGLSPRILVVDDNAAGREMQASMLAVVGFETEMAGNGELALEKLRTGDRYRVILLDKLMPGLDGFETLKRIRALPEGGDTPVLILTASGFADESVTVRLLGGNGVLPKPIRMEHLLEEIQRVSGVIYDSVEEASPALPKAPTSAHGGPPEAYTFSESFRSRLKDAVRRGEIGVLRSLIQELATDSTEQAEMVGRMVDAYDYGGLTRLLAHTELSRTV